MVLISVLCPHCQSDNIVKRGKTDIGEQRHLCKNYFCPHSSFRLEYSYKGRLPEIKHRIIEMALNGSGIRDTARALNISPTTVINELKKESSLESVNYTLLKTLRGQEVVVKLLRIANKTLRK